MLTTAHAPDTRRAGALAGLPVAVRLAWRRSRIYYPVWVVALVATTLGTVAAYETIAPPGTSLKQTMSALAGNPTMRAMLGPPFDLMTAGGFTMWRVGTFVAAALAFMAAFGVIRATRAEEEDGRVELLRSGVVARHTPLAAALLLAGTVSAVTGLLIAAGLARSAPPTAGALAAGLGIAGTGLIGAGVGAVTAQLSASARGARTLASAVLGAAYLLRALADGSSESSWVRRLAWVSPLEWAALSRPYADERWWVLALPLLTGTVLTGVAFRAQARRNHGAGLLAAAAGPATGSMGSAAALARRLQRPAVIGWTVGIVAFALTIGSLSDSFAGMLKDAPQLAEILRRMGGGAQLMRDAFYVTMLALVSVVMAMCGVQLLAGLHREEERGRADLVLSTPTTRWAFAAGHLIPALVWPTLLLVLAGAGLGVNQAVSQGNLEPVLRVVGAALALAPGVWCCVGFAMSLHGLVPTHTGLAWALVGWSLFTTWVGAILGLPDWVVELTPFAHLPRMPSQPWAWTPVLVTTAVAIGLTVVGMVGYRRRDIG